jgi:hypothetical protein
MKSADLPVSGSDDWNCSDWSFWVLTTGTAHDDERSMITLNVGV